MLQKWSETFQNGWNRLPSSHKSTINKFWKSDFFIFFSIFSWFFMIFEILFSSKFHGAIDSIFSKTQEEILTKLSGSSYHSQNSINQPSDRSRILSRAVESSEFVKKAEIFFSFQCGVMWCIWWVLWLVWEVRWWFFENRSAVHWRRVVNRS